MRMHRGTLASMFVGLLVTLTGAQPAIAAQRATSTNQLPSKVTRPLAKGGLTDQEGSGPDWCGQYGGYGLGAEYEGVYACGPAVGEADPFDSVGFQCVELSARFLWVVYGRYVSNIPSGRDFVADAHRQLHLPVGLPGPGSVPVPGDIMSIAGGDTGWTYGHTGVVAAVDVNSQGNGHIRMMEQNASAGGWGKIYVNHWIESYGSPGLGSVNAISWLETGTPPVTLPLGEHVKFVVQPLGKRMTVTGINKSGEATGLKTFHIGAQQLVQRPFLYRFGKVHVLAAPTSVGSLTETSSINDAGQMAVSAEAGKLPSVAFAIDPNAKAKWQRLPNPVPHPGASAALGINYKGEIAGWLAGRDSRKHTFGVVWTPHVHKRKVGYGRRKKIVKTVRYTSWLYRSAPKFDDVRVYASDRVGDAVGTETSPAGVFYPTIWLGSGGRWRLPAAIGGHPAPGTASVLSMGPKDNPRILTVIGSSNGVNSSIESTEWRIKVIGRQIKILKIKHLGMVSQAQESIANDVNSHGWVVGDSIAPRKQHSAQLAFLVRPKVGMLPLDLMVGQHHWVVAQAEAVNANGQVAAEGHLLVDGKRGPKEALLLTPKERQTSS